MFLYFFKRWFNACSWTNDFGILNESRSSLEVYTLWASATATMAAGITHSSRVGRASHSVPPRMMQPAAKMRVTLNPARTIMSLDPLGGVLSEREIEP